MRGAITTAILLAAGVGAPAHGVRPGTAVVLEAQQTGLGCPVGVTAERRGTGDVMVTRGVDGAAQGGSGLRITMRAEQGRRIESATVLVHGLSSKNRVVPAGTDARPDVNGRFTLVSTGKDVFVADIHMSRVVTILSLDVTELRYSDGFVWRASESASCRVTPDGLVLVASTQ